MNPPTTSHSWICLHLGSGSSPPSPATNFISGFLSMLLHFFSVTDDQIKQWRRFLTSDRAHSFIPRSISQAGAGGGGVSCPQKEFRLRRGSKIRISKHWESRGRRRGCGWMTDKEGGGIPGGCWGAQGGSSGLAPMPDVGWSAHPDALQE